MIGLAICIISLIVFLAKKCDIGLIDSILIAGSFVLVQSKDDWAFNIKMDIGIWLAWWAMAEFKWIGNPEPEKNE